MSLISNQTIPVDDCTLSTCPLSEAQLDYVPSLGGNALYLGILAICLIAQLVLGIKYRTWGFLVAMVGGLILEIIGYAARIQMHYNPFPSGPFLMYATPDLSRPP